MGLFPCLALVSNWITMVHATSAWRCTDAAVLLGIVGVVLRDGFRIPYKRLSTLLPFLCPSIHHFPVKNLNAMHINLDNISFYPQPPPAKPPPRAFPISCWKPYETPLASRAISRALPPRAPTPRTTITLASDARLDVSPRSRAPAREDHDLRAVCNEFDIELERIVRAQNCQVTREADLTLHRDLGLPNGNDTDGPQDQCTSSVLGMSDCLWSADQRTSLMLIYQSIQTSALS